MIYNIAIIGSFQVQNASISVINESEGFVCFSCYFVEGALTNSCYVEYTSLYTETIGNMTAIKKPLNQTVATKCDKGLYTDIYTVRFHDDKYDESAAIELKYQLVTGLPLDDLFPCKITAIFSNFTELSYKFLSKIILDNTTYYETTTVTPTSSSSSSSINTGGTH